MATASRIADRLGEITARLNALDGVFSTAQWGGRAFKVPRTAGDRRNARLLAFVKADHDAGTVGVMFKLEKSRAEDLIERFDWIERHSFRTLGGSGWLTANVRTKRHFTALGALLDESRTLYPATAASPTVRRSSGRDSEREGDSHGEAGGSTSSSVTSEAARRIERVMREARADGWSPDSGDW
jgi:hypothetical protein